MCIFVRGALFSQLKYINWSCHKSQASRSEADPNKIYSGHHSVCDLLALDLHAAILEEKPAEPHCGCLLVISLHPQQSFSPISENFSGNTANFTTLIVLFLYFT